MSEVFLIEKPYDNYKREIEVAELEKNTKWQKVLTGAGISIGTAAWAVALDKLKVARAEKQGLIKARALGENIPTNVVADIKEEAGKTKSTLGGMVKELGPSAPAISEAAFSGAEQDASTRHAQIEAIKTSREMFNKQMDRLEADYQECRRRYVEILQVAVNLHGQAQQSAAWKG